jgi:hypothetical protein
MGETLHHAIANVNSFWYFMKCCAEWSIGIPISRKPEHTTMVFKGDKKKLSDTQDFFKGKEVVTDRVKE